ncbi:E3 ubiquitin-protein ligase HECTD1 [Paragonimus heterotremus]|uniref:E3 ubiquitin-protein ligase n=1 Tax=Paragonimus heterotremus TaxID=100268 RepID=A0A8J4WT25_9TREM|nr:E3 ubiquitin-protein ligase HECTD1 [Paragonimus heterotremus]
MPLTQFVNLPEQLLTRTIQLRPMLVDHPREETNGTSVPNKSTYSRKVDLSTYHLYVQPLATVHQLQKWILKTAKKIPWYNDELKHMGFVYDLKHPPNRVCLVPPETPVGNALTTGHNIFWGGVFAWLGTNGGRESKWANPLRLHGLVRMISSDSQLNADPFLLGLVLANPTMTSRRARRTLGTTGTTPRLDDTHSSVWIRPSETESFTNYSTAWIAFDLGLHIYLTHYMIQVPILSDHWPELTDWQLQGSTNGLTWTVLSEHHITVVGHPKFYWGNDGERLWQLTPTSCLNGNTELRSWRFLRLQLLPSNGHCETSGVTLPRANSLPLRGIEFFGTVTKVFIKPDKEAQNEAYAYLGQLRSGTFVVPAIPLPICGRTSYSSVDKIHHECWPHLNLTALGTRLQMTLHETHSRPSISDSTGIHSEPPLLGKVLRDLKDGYVSVQWLTGYTDQMFNFRSQKQQSPSLYAMGANQRFDLRIPSEEEVRLRLKLLCESDRVKQDAENPVSSSSAMYPCAANHEASVPSPDTGVKGGQEGPNDFSPNEQSLDCALVPTRQSLTSYLLPMSQNWLADALLPTFNRVLPFLFNSYSPQFVREPPVLKPLSSSQMVITASQPQPSSSLHGGTTQAAASNWKDRRSVSAEKVAVGLEELLIPEAPVYNGPITGPDITDHNVKLQTPDCPDNNIPGNTDSPTNGCLIVVKSRSNSACSSTVAHVPETLDSPENLLSLPRCKISGSDDEPQEVEGQSEFECDSDDGDDENELNQIDEKAGICDDQTGAQTSQATNRMNYTPRHEDQFDAALETIGRTLELRVLANAKEAGLRTSCPLEDDETVPRAPKRAHRRRFAKFDQWERKDPICVHTIIQQCMNLCVINLPDATQSATHSCLKIPDQPGDPTASSCSQLQLDGEFSSVQPSDRLPTEISMLGGGLSNNQPDERSLREMIVKTDQCADTLVPPLVLPAIAPANPSRDLKPVPRNRPTNKPILRSRCCEEIKMETIESNLDGLIPPFETRSGTSHLPSTVSFSIPVRIPWPPAGLSTADTLTTGNTGPASNTTHVRLWLHQEQTSDTMLNPPGASSLSTLSPTSSGSTSFCSMTTTKSDTPCLVPFGPTLPEVPVDPTNTQQMTKFSLVKPEVNLVHYLLRFMDYTEEFSGSGVLRPTGWQLSRMWNRTYLLDYHLESSGSIENTYEKTVNRQPAFPNATELSHPPFADEGLLDQLLDLIGLLYELVSYRTEYPRDLRSNSMGCEWTTGGGLMEKRCDSSTSEVARISDFGYDSFPNQQVITVPYSTDESSFHSTRLTRKLMLYAHDVWSILASSHLLSNPDFQASDCDQVLSWVPRFVMQYKFLFPFETRLEFWRVSSLGASRAIAWLQKQAGNTRVSSNPQTFVTSVPSFLQRMEASTNALRDRCGFKSFGCDFSWTPSVLVVPNKDNTRSEWCTNVYCDTTRTGSTGNWFSFGVPPSSNLSVVTPGIGIGTSGAGFNQSTLTSLGRLQRHTTRVPRPQTANIPSGLDTEKKTNGVEQIILNDRPYTFFSGGNDFWSTTVRLLLVHADKHQELEVEFEGEEGTGLGPTMEFYALLSAELRRHSHGLWVSEDRADRINQALDLTDDPNENCMSDDWDPALLADYPEVDTGNATTRRKKLPQEDTNYDTDMTDIGDDFYVNPPFGLFPAPWPANQLPPGTELRFYILGIAVAKCLVDQRQMDLPFSNAFLTLLCKFVGDGEQYCQNKSVARSSTDWPAAVLDLVHFTEIYPERGKFVNNLILYLRERDALKNEQSEYDLEAADMDLQKRIFSAELRSLCIDMCFPSVTRKFGQTDFPLTEDYEPEMIELDHPTEQPKDKEELLISSTVEAYIRRSLEFALNKGIRRQLHAFKAGFERVAPLRSLAMFTPQELGRLISGESCPEWTTTEIWANCEPAAGYNRQSKGFLLLIEGLASFDVSERRKFLRFVTGCPTLPPGGLRNLHPKLKVAKKDGSTCGPFPSVNTCMHYLKLPEYETVNELKQYLLAAASQTGFYLN